MVSSWAKRLAIPKLRTVRFAAAQSLHARSASMGSTWLISRARSIKKHVFKSSARQERDWFRIIMEYLFVKSAPLIIASSVNWKESMKCAISAKAPS